MFEVSILACVLGQSGALASHTERMIAAQPPESTLLADDPAFILFVETAGGYTMYLRHTTRVCCLESYVPYPHSFDWWYYPYPVMPLFDPGYRVMDLPPDHPYYPECQHQGQQFASYPLGLMEDIYDGPIGYWTGPPPLTLGHNIDCAWDDPNVIVWSGITPNTQVELDWLFTCMGDHNGDGVVGINDFLRLLAFWGIFDVADFLELLANWGPCQ